MPAAQRRLAPAALALALAACDTGVFPPGCDEGAPPAPTCEPLRGGELRATDIALEAIREALRDRSADAPTLASASAQRGDEAEAPQRVPGAAPERLRDPDPEVRASAAEWLPLEPATFSALAELLRSDPAPEVRAAAASTLGEAMRTPEQREAVDLMLGALYDSEPRVVVAALGSLALVGDAGIAPELAFLLAHQQPAVRDAASGALAFLED
jgi:HEAT repeat protein